jgi:hypothetical protein
MASTGGGGGKVVPEVGITLFAESIEGAVLACTFRKWVLLGKLT